MSAISFGLGCKPDLHDNRDLKIDQLGLSAFGAPPRAASLFDPRTRIRNQRATSSCVGHAVASGVRLAFLIGDGKDCPELSPLFSYFNARGFDGNQANDDGTSMRAGVKAAQKWGIASEAAWPFDPKQVNAMPNWGAFRDAYDTRGIRGYYRIPMGDVESVRLAIAARRPVIAGWLIDEPFMRYAGGVYEMARGPYLGGHALCVESYDGDVFTLINSWGSGWGESGRVRVSVNFILQARDIWALDT